VRTLLLGILTLALICFGTGPVFATDDGSEPGLPAEGGPGLRDTGDASLTTMFAQNNGHTGNSFDIEANVDLTVVGWDCNLDAGPRDVEIWTRPGTADGFEGSTAGWTLLGSETVMGAGVDLPTHVDVGGLSMAAGEVVGVIARTNDFGTFQYTNGSPPGGVHSNADMIITTYRGLDNNWPPSSMFFVREWNGTVHYDYAASTPVDETTWGSIKAVFQ